MTDLDPFYCAETGRVFTYRSTRVTLNETSGYDASSEDPVWGSEYECYGLLDAPANDEEYPIQVVWDNGHKNQYRPSDLDIVGHRTIKKLFEDDNPNKTYKQQKVTSSIIKHKESTLSTIEKVKQLMQHTGIPLTEATKALQRYNGDVDSAITYTNLDQDAKRAQIGSEMCRLVEDFAPPADLPVKSDAEGNIYIQEVLEDGTKIVTYLDTHKKKKMKGGIIIPNDVVTKDRREEEWVNPKKFNDDF